jgi:hypothetical protein
MIAVERHSDHGLFQHPQAIALKFRLLSVRVASGASVSNRKMSVMEMFQQLLHRSYSDISYSIAYSIAWQRTGGGVDCSLLLRAGDPGYCEAGS